MQNELPPEFDLLWDIKTMEQLHAILFGAMHCTEVELWELEELMCDLSMPLPAGYTPTLKAGFPTTVWIDNNGGYQEYAPTYEEAHKYQRMQRR